MSRVAKRAESDSRYGGDLRFEERSVRRWLRYLTRPQTLILTGVVVTVGYLALVPLVYLLWGTFFDATGFTVGAFQEAYRGNRLAELVSNSVLYAIGATTVSLVIGTFLAYLTERTGVAFKPLIFAGAVVPLIVPGILYTIAWIFLASPRIGLINQLLEPLLGPGTFDVFSLGGMIVVQGMDSAPLVFLLMVASFRSQDPALEESALVSGASIRTVIWRITLPMNLPGLFGAGLIMLVNSLQSFETPALLGLPGGVWVFTSQIWRSLNDVPPDYAVAGALSASLLVITTVGIYVHARLTRRGDRYQTVTGKGFRPRPLPLGRWRLPLSLMTLGYFTIAIVVPVAILVYMSTQPFYNVPSLSSLADATWANYSYVIGHEQVARSFRNSFVLAIGAGAVVMLLAAVASWIVVRGRTRGRWLLDNLMATPLVMPGLVIGVALLFIYLRAPVQIYGTMWILLIAYCTIALPYGMRYATTSMHQIGGDLEESAQVSGGTWWQIFWRVHLPLLMPGLLAGWIYIVMTSVRELSSSILLYSPGNEVLSIMIWEQYQNGQFTELAALGTLMIAALVLLVLAAQKLSGRIGIRA